MIHDEYIALALRDFDDPLEPEHRRRLADHLATCSVCRAEVDLLANAHDGLQSWGSERAPVPRAPAVSLPSPGRTPRLWPPLAAAGLAGILLGAAGGFAAGRHATTGADASATAIASGSRFTLLLEEPSGTWPPVAGDMRPGYVEWRDSLLARDQFIGGDRFSTDGGWYVARGLAQPVESLTTAGGGVNYSGYFVVRARDYAEAVEIAKGSPHLNHGGILVRRSSPPDR